MVSNTYGVFSIVDAQNWFELSACFDLQKKKYYFPSLVFHLGEDEQIMWDNEQYIFGEFKPFLIRWKKRELLPHDKMEFITIWDKLNEDSVEDLLEILSAGEEMGWNNID